MEMKIDGLIEKIKQEGIDQAKHSAENIICEAEENAAKILQEKI